MSWCGTDLEQNMLRYDHKSAISNVQTRCIILFALSYTFKRVHSVTIKSGWLALRVSVSEEGTFNLIKKFKQVNNSFLQTLRNQVMDYSNAISNLYKSLRSDIISVILNWLYTFRFWTYFLFLFVFSRSFEKWFQKLVALWKTRV